MADGYTDSADRDEEFCPLFRACAGVPARTDALAHRNSLPQWCPQRPARGQRSIAAAGALSTLNGFYLQSAGTPGINVFCWNRESTTPRNMRSR
jgi:hypothetical protein